MNISWWFDFGTVFFELVTTEMSKFHILPLLYLYSWVVNYFWIIFLNPPIVCRTLTEKFSVVNFRFFVSKRSTSLNIYFCFNKKMLGCFKVFLFEVVLLLDVVRQKKLLDNQIKDCEIVGFWLFLKKITVKETKSAMSFSAWNEFKR